ncbi:uncharacterized protein TRIADDRAFT_56105 [Trichoplax adhaerens]|uniref:Uncharacterized protein n=1 Tax=Trichoplax adhaerens TaxID=10228 RepID=B3RU00_TRIAD|nr:predicted protein [Trichoplax adhaerens]EDV25715.1 predicted protein [Trichoplax adhaerens]|eukprot:XP_002111748.1 predicted protein [Trichoplax adhaerens]
MTKAVSSEVLDYSSDSYRGLISYSTMPSVLHSAKTNFKSSIMPHYYSSYRYYEGQKMVLCKSIQVAKSPRNYKHFTLSHNKRKKFIDHCLTSLFMITGANRKMNIKLALIASLFLFAVANATEENYSEFENQLKEEDATDDATLMDKDEGDEDDETEQPVDMIDADKDREELETPMKKSFWWRRRRRRRHDRRRVIIIPQRPFWRRRSHFHVP